MSSCMYVAMSFYGKKTYATPKRKTLASERVGLHPRKENCATEECYRRGMRLTAINPNPVNYNSDSDNSSNGDGNLDGDYSFDTRRPTQPEHDRPSFQSPHFQQRTQSPFSTPSPASQKNWISMLQQQQAILHELLEGQKRLEKRQDCFEDQLADLASKVEQPIPTTPSSSSSEGKRKRMVTRTLSVSLSNCYSLGQSLNCLCSLSIGIILWLRSIEVFPRSCIFMGRP